MKFLEIVITATASFVTLFILSKTFGNKQISQLTIFDYINGITIGSIAAELATTGFDEFWKPLIAMAIYGIFVVLITKITEKSLSLRRFFVGTTIIIFENGKIFQENLKKAKIDLNEFLSECRLKGYFDISNIRLATIEPNGRIAILPTDYRQPLTRGDMNMLSDNNEIRINIILDGQILDGNLKYTGNNREWLHNTLEKQGYTDIKNIFLATCDRFNNVSIYPKSIQKPDRDIFK